MARTRSNARHDRAYRKWAADEAAGKLTPAQRAERRLADAVKAFRKRAELHDSSPDAALVRYAHGKGERLTGAAEVREASSLLEVETITGEPRDIAPDSLN